MDRELEALARFIRDEFEVEYGASFAHYAWCGARVSLDDCPTDHRAEERQNQALREGFLS